MAKQQTKPDENEQIIMVTGCSDLLIIDYDS